MAVTGDLSLRNSLTGRARGMNVVPGWFESRADAERHAPPGYVAIKDGDVWRVVDNRIIGSVEAREWAYQEAVRVESDIGPLSLAAWEETFAHYLGEWHRVRGKSAPALSPAPPAADGKALMDHDNAIWDALGITSGSHLRDDPSLQAKYEAAIRKRLGAPTGQFGREEFEVLEDQNYHAMNEALSRLGYYGPLERPGGYPKAKGPRMGVPFGEGATVKQGKHSAKCVCSQCRPGWSPGQPWPPKGGPRKRGRGDAGTADPVGLIVVGVGVVMVVAWSYKAMKRGGIA